jgi:hypothetical protein
MEYEYRPVWSFFGGQTVEEPWQKTTIGTIPITPPYKRRIVDLQADPKTIADAGVRSITVKLFYELGGAEQVKQVTLNIVKGQLSEQVEFMTPGTKLEYDYEIQWQLKGNRTASSGRQKSTVDLLFVDGIPQS